MITRLRVGGSDVRIPVGERGYSLLQNAQASSGSHPGSYSMGTTVISRG